MPPDREAALEAIPNWCWDPHSASWNTRYNHLCNYVEANKKLPPIDTPVGAWANTQRYLKRKATITPERQARLESVPGWYWDPNAAAWDRQLAHLRAYTEDHRAPPHHKTQLGNWVRTQRAALRGGVLTPDRKAALYAIPGWVW